jgi:hypothetical protein
MNFRYVDIKIQKIPNNKVAKIKFSLIMLLNNILFDSSNVKI